MDVRDAHILHLNDVAQTGRNLVGYARSQGRHWGLRTLPAGSGPLMEVAGRRLIDLGHWLREPDQADLLHVHYAPNAYYAWVKHRPHVVHVHGTDLRQDLYRRGIGTLTRRALERADLVVAATPDLLEQLQQLRPDAIHVPNPVPYRALSQPIAPRDPQGPIVFNARWDDSKGAPELLDAAAHLVQQGHRVVGLDWGQWTSEARDVGVELRPLGMPAQFRSLLESASVVVGQVGIDALTISDLETLVVGRPLVTRAQAEGAPVAAPTPNILTAVMNLIMHPQEATQLGLTGRQWVETERGPARSLERWEDLYQRILN